MSYFNKDEIKKQLDVSQVFELLINLGAEPQYNSTGIVAQTICHNEPGEGSHKLYYWENSHLFVCFTSCGTFDIFDLIIKAIKIQKGINWTLYDAMKFVVEYFGMTNTTKVIDVKEQDIDIYQKKHEFSQNVALSTFVELKQYDDMVLRYLPSVIIKDWKSEGIKEEACYNHEIKYEPNRQQIVIPHYDINHRLIGIRGRSLCDDVAQMYGKYRPLYLNGILYTHPLSRNLYGIDKNAKNIARSKIAIIAEGEKSVLQFESFYGAAANIVVACCGSAFSNYQAKMLWDLGVKEIIIAFDRQFQEIGDEEFKKLKNKLISIGNKLKNYFQVSCIFDKNMITNYKDSPFDCGKETFEKLLKERIIL